jgi:hypothetical protein
MDVHREAMTSSATAHSIVGYEPEQPASACVAGLTRAQHRDHRQRRTIDDQLAPGYRFRVDRYHHPIQATALDHRLGT